MTYRLLLPIAVLFAATLLVSNTLDTKVLSIAGFSLPAGTLVFPLAYVFGDILTEVYGYRTARIVIWSGFLALVFMTGFYELARVMPPADFWNGQDSFDRIFGNVPRIVLASIAAYLCGEFVNAYVLATMKIKMQGRKMWWRFLASTFVGQFVDTAVFIVIAFTGVYALRDLAVMGAAGWALKTGWEILALPLTIVLTRRIKKIEGADHFDHGTDFNPFRFGTG